MAPRANTAKAAPPAKPAGKPVGKAKTAKAAPTARPKPAPEPEPVPGAPAGQNSAPCLSLAHKRRLAKNGMAASLAVLTVTAFTGAHKKGLSRSLHLASGAALLAFSLWHHCLYSGKKAAQCPAPQL